MLIHPCIGQHATGLRDDGQKARRDYQTADHVLTAGLCQAVAGERGFEREIRKRLDYWAKLRTRAKDQAPDPDEGSQS